MVEATDYYSYVPLLNVECIVQGVEARHGVLKGLHVLLSIVRGTWVPKGMSDLSYVGVL